MGKIKKRACNKNDKKKNYVEKIICVMPLKKIVSITRVSSSLDLTSRKLLDILMTRKYLKSLNTPNPSINHLEKISKFLLFNQRAT